MIFSQRLKDLLGAKGVTWKEVSENLSIGKNQQKYWEDKDSAPDGKTLIKLCQYFDVSSDYLLGLDTLKENCEITTNNTKVILQEEEQFILDTFRTLSRSGKAKAYQTLLNIRDEEIKQGKSAVIV